MFVVPIDAGDVDMLTLGEWDALLASGTVFFEEPGHPLEEKLARAGCRTATLGDAGELGPDDALIAQPGSKLVLKLARMDEPISTGAATAPDPVTAAYGAAIARRGAAALGELLLVMARLRSPEGCPWDLEQDHASLTKHLSEEADEVIHAIQAGTLGSELEEELGDVLLQVVFHAQMAQDDGRFDITAVARTLVAKLLHRHPHVFGDTRVAGADEVKANWDAIKRGDKAGADDAVASWRARKREDRGD
ncbi:MAG TPA: MazG nucleotide pyrophosphohydrolase domain-containing protein [Actinomycetota bacterium]|nr:MazG nucleotide pyrophosphohydrolase domain-containing protein [Actinomycetota bacterium]